MRTPEFWSQNDTSTQATSAALAPLSWLYGVSVALKRDYQRSWRPLASVVCVGNLTVGGSGKTPVAQAVARALLAKGLRAVFLTRGYGGSLPGPVVVNPYVHSAAEVGDEPLLLGALAPTIVSADRKTGAILADAQGADVIVMDDGHQNFALKKDVSIVVVDAERGFGNGRVLPAGPLREPVAQGLARADAVVLVGDGTPDLPGFGGKILRARFFPEAVGLNGIRTVAFAGIAQPEKFFLMLEKIGADIVARHAFADHHAYKPEEVARLKEEAVRIFATLVTTEKDRVRLSVEDRADIFALPIRAEFDSPESLAWLLERLDNRVA